MAVTSSWRSSQTTERLAVARIIGAKGLAGAVKVEPLTDWPEHLDADAEVYLEGEEQPRRIRRSERGGRVPALVLDGIASREAAEAVIGQYLEVVPGVLPEGEYYWHQLEGLQVRDEAGTELGTVREVFRAGEAEVYLIERPGGGELLIPAIREVVRSIDLDARCMIVRYEVEETG
jgi:16S rRNA processing protein RimM